MVLFLGLARGADAPIDDLGLIDDEVVIVGGLKAWSMADGAVDIDGRGALSANEMMMVVADAGLVERRASGRFDPAKDTSGGKGVEVVEYRLPGKSGQPPSRGTDDELSVLVLALKVDGLDDGDSLRGDAQVGLSEKAFDLGTHDGEIT
jgi:hypothetical protein